MGHKVHPNAFRLGVIRGWEANWFASSRDYTKLLHEDLEMRRTIMTRLRNAGIAKIETERSSNAQMTVTIHTAKPGIVIGKGGASVDQLREQLERRFPGNRIRISIQEIKHPEMDAQLVAENIASQIERRINHRRAMKQSMLRTMRSGAKGIRITLAGRLRGGEMARREWLREGRVPLHTLRADIDFGRAVARTTFGVIGVKCWIYKDLVEPKKRGGEQPAADGQADDRQPRQQPDGQPPQRRRRRRGGSGGQGGGDGQGGGPRQGQQGQGASQGGGPRQGQGGPQGSGARQGQNQQGQGGGGPRQGQQAQGQGSPQRQGSGEGGPSGSAEQSRPAQPAPEANQPAPIQPPPGANRPAPESNSTPPSSGDES